MISIEEKINFFKENLELFDDDMDKYKYLLDQAKNAKKFPEEYRQESFKVDGCQAQVWLVPYIEQDKLCFHSDSDAFISKGMVTILCEIYGGRMPNEIAKANFDLLSSLQLDTLLTPGRRNGVHSMLMKIKEYAKVYNQKTK
ncbi:SufE family protein [bacterium]|nr:SufE family protein [bacterium]